MNGVGYWMESGERKTKMGGNGVGSGEERCAGREQLDSQKA